MSASINYLNNFPKIAIITAFEPEAQFLPDHLLHVNSGIGLIQAAAATQKLIDFEHPDLIINLGIAAGLDSKIRRGDLVIANQLEHIFSSHDQFSEWGFIKTFASPEILSPKHAEHLQTTFAGTIYFGTIASSNYFISPANRAETLAQTNALAVDMESSAIGEIAAKNSVAYLILRIISDTGDQDSIYQAESDQLQTDQYIHQVTQFLFTLLALN
jgi:adenosylhomocysteine nucleosidase